MSRSRPRLIIVGPTPPPMHGAAVCVQMYLNSKLRRSFDLVHLDTSDRRTLSNIGKFDFGNVCLALRNISQMIAFCLTGGPHIIYIPISQGSLGYLRDGLFIITGRFFSNAKIVIHLHGGYFRTFYDQTDLFMKLFIDLTMKYCDKVIVLGDCMRWIFDRWFDDEDIEVVPNATPMNPELTGKYDLEKKFYNITYLGNLLKTKGIIDVIKSVKPVSSMRKNVKYRIAGSWLEQEPETRIECVNFIEANGLNRFVEFLGVVTGKDKEKLLVDTDIFVFPTYYPPEGHPCVIIEAMSAGCPIISTNHATIPETVIDGETGLLVEKRNPRALADAIMKLIEDPELRIRMGKAGRKRYEKLYTQEKIIADMVGVFERALERQ